MLCPEPLTKDLLLLLSFLPPTSLICYSSLEGVAHGLLEMLHLWPGAEGRIYGHMGVGLSQ